MGRPLRKDVFGTSVIGSFNTASQKDPTGSGIKVEFYDGTAFRSDGIIIKQRGARTFVVAQDSNFQANVNLNSTPNKFTCVLVDATPAAIGQMRLFGYVSPTTGGSPSDSTSIVNIRKITKRVATGFNDVKYNWYLDNDSTADYIVLTPVAA